MYSRTFWAAQYSPYCCAHALTAVTTHMGLDGFQVP